MNSDDQIIRTMFQELKVEDESKASSFTHDWNAAQLRMSKPRFRWAVWQMSAGVAAMSILLGTGWMFLRQSSMETAPIGVSTADTTTPNTRPPFISPPVPQIPSTPLASSVRRNTSAVSGTPTHTKASHYIAARQHPVRQLQESAALISQWRSPTESLLRIPGESLLKRVPRLDDSVVTINTMISNKNN